MTSTQIKEFVAQDPAASFWLKEAVRSVSKRDSLDAYMDALYLVKYCRQILVENDKEMNDYLDEMIVKEVM